MGDLLAALTLVFTAEIGDKSQLVVLTLSPGTDTRRLMVGLAVATAGLSAMAVLAGAAVGAALPERPLALGVGLLFIALGLAAWFGSLRDTGHGSDPVPSPGPYTPRSPASVRRVVLAFVAAELGDKTQLATASMAAAGSAWAVWAGASLGFFTAATLAVMAGRWLHGRMSETALARVGAIGFLVVGTWELISLAA